jgi:hypothetical protein
MEELAAVLVKSAPIEFKALFTIVHGNLKSRNAANGGEEMLRLRSYEKLQSLVQSGFVEKVGKEYRGVLKALVPYLEAAAAQLEGEVPPAASKQRATLTKAVSPKNRRPARPAIAIS